MHTLGNQHKQCSYLVIASNSHYHLLSLLPLSPLQINKLHLCKPLIRAIDSSDIKDKFWLSELVTYKLVLCGVYCYSV